MMAANYRHIGGGENRLGRHYSRFSAFWPPAAPADQSLALRKSQNAGSNRRSRVRRAPAHSNEGITAFGARLPLLRTGTIEFPAADHQLRGDYRVERSSASKLCT